MLLNDASHVGLSYVRVFPDTSSFWAPVRASGRIVNDYNQCDLINRAFKCPNAKYSENRQNAVNRLALDVVEPDQGAVGNSDVHNANEQVSK